MTKLAVPKDVLSSHTAVLGKSGSGKTYATRGIVEWLLQKKRRVCIIDPTGVSWGLRLDKDGKARGFDIVIFGGKHGDLPLVETQGAALAEIIGTSSTPAIIDTRLMTVGARTRFFADFAETLLRKNQGPLHLVVDEAHLFAPQGKVNDPQSGKMLHAANNLVSLGRSAGLRIILISQRPAKLHKDALTQAETLIAMRLIAPHDRRAVEDWVGEWIGDSSQSGADVVDSLPSLPTGTGWVWAPVLGKLDKVKFPTISTFDSMKAPDEADVQRALPPIDLDKVGTQLKTVAEQAKANDPAVLKARIAELERSAAKVSTKQVDRQAVDQSRKRAATVKTLSAAIEAAMRILIEIRAQNFFKADAAGIIDQAQVQKAMEGALANISKSVEAILKVRNDRIDKLQREADRVIAKLTAAIDQDVAISVDVKHNEPFTISAPASAVMTPSPRRGNGASADGMDAAQRAFLTVLAQRGTVLTRDQIAIFAGYSAASRHVDNTLSALRAKGWIDGEGRSITLTNEGRDAVGNYQPLPTGADLQALWIGKLDKAAGAFLQFLCSSYPDTLARDDIAHRTGYSPTSRHVDNTLSTLRARCLIVGRGDAIKAADELFA